MDKYISITDAAREKGCTRSTVYEWIDKGLLNCEMLANKRLIVYDETFKTLIPQKRGRKGNLLAELKQLREKLAHGAKKTPFTAVYIRNGAWWLGFVKEYPGALCQEKTIEEARESLKGVLVDLMDLQREAFQKKFKSDFGEEGTVEENLRL